MMATISHGTKCSGAYMVSSVSHLAIFFELGKRQLTFHMEALLIEGQHIWHAQIHTKIPYLTHLGQVITKSNFNYYVILKLAGDLLSVGLIIQKSFFFAKWDTLMVRRKLNTLRLRKLVLCHH